MMKVFLDTNVFLEYFEQRRECQAVGQLLSAVEDGRLKAIVSAGCVYTLTYLIRMELKRKDIHRPEQTLRLRTMLNTVMSMVTVGGLSHKRIIEGLNGISKGDENLIGAIAQDLQNHIGLINIMYGDY